MDFLVFLPCAKLVWLKIWVSYRSSTWRWHWVTHLAKTGGSSGQSRSSSGFWYVTGELDVWKVRWCKTPRGSLSHGKLTDITDIHLIRYDLRRKKHVQIASNCVVLPLGTQIEGQWFYRWPEVTTQMVAVKNGFIARCTLLYVGWQRSV